MTFVKTFVLFCILLFLGNVLFSQNQPLVYEAETGSLGSDFNQTEEGGVQAITISSNLINASNPGSTDRVVSYLLTFTEAGTYDIYMRILTGPGTYNDDSFFLGKGFGEKNAENNEDWIIANGLAGIGYSFIYDVVNAQGSVGSEIWKWVNISELLSNQTFTVSEGSLEQTLQIGAREDGLYFDKIVFGKSDLFFTVANLNNGEQGSIEKPANEPTGTPLAEGQDKYLGCAWDYGQAYNFASYWNQSTPGNAGKWGSVESTRDVMNWSVLDSTYNVAKRHNMLFKEHTLFWGAQQPSWIASLNTTEQREEIEEWVAAFSERYPDIDYIDVVNEPIHNGPNGIVPWGATEPNVNYAEALGGAGETGWDWIIESFRLARQYFPKSKLILNEYNVINNTSTTEEYIKIINLLKEENLIDGIGEQAHAFTTKETSTANLKKNMDALAATGIPLHLTEVDIDGLSDLEQLTEMKRVFSLFWEHPAVEGITLWGFRFGVWRQDQGAYLINEDGSERAALVWLKAYVNDTLHNVQSVKITSNSGNFKINEKEGSLNLIAEVLPANATISNISWAIEPAGLASIDENGVLRALKNGVVTVTASAWDNSNIQNSVEVNISNQGTGFENLSDSKITVYPNPTNNGFITISGITEIHKIDVLSISGKILSSFSNMGNESLHFQINQPKGIYVVRLFDESKPHYRKFIIR